MDGYLLVLDGFLHHAVYEFLLLSICWHHEPPIGLPILLPLRIGNDTVVMVCSSASHSA